MKKVCNPSKYVIIEFDSDSIDMGSLPDIFKKIMAAVHHTNVNSDGNYCAITFQQPEKTGGLGIGERAIVYGDDIVLNNFMKNNYIVEMKRKGMVFISRIKDTNMDTNEGVYVSKVRKQNITENFINTINRRRISRGHNPIEKFNAKVVEIEGEINRVYCCIKKNLFLTMSIGEKAFSKDGNFEVSSYGISSQQNIVVFPKV